MEISAKYQVKDESGNAVLVDGQPRWDECAIEYDMGDTLDASVDLFGKEAVHSQFIAGAKVAIQGIMRAKMKQGMTADQIKDFFANYKVGMVLERTQVDPLQATVAAFATWSDEKKAEFLKTLGIEVG